MLDLNAEILEKFARSYDPPHWIIEQVLESGGAQVKAALSAALEEISDVAVADLDQDTNARLDIMFRSSDQRVRAKLYLLCRVIERELQRRRFAQITAGAATRSKPYDHPVLRDVAVDADGLVPLSAFKINGDALCRNGEAFFVLPAVPSTNSNYWLLQNIQRHDLTDTVSVRLDPLLLRPSWPDIFIGWMSMGGRSTGIGLLR